MPITSLRASRGNCFKRSRILISSSVCLDWGDWAACGSVPAWHPSAFADLACLLEAGGSGFGGACFGAAWPRFLQVFFFFPFSSGFSALLLLAAALSYFLRASGSAKVSRASYTKWKASLLPPLSGCTCKARFLKASLISSKVAFWSTSSTSYRDTGGIKTWSNARLQPLSASSTCHLVSYFLLTCNFVWLSLLESKSCSENQAIKKFACMLCS